MSGIGGMSMDEIDRIGVIKALVTGEIKPAVAALRLGLGARQVHRLAVRFTDCGVAGLISQQRGKASNRQLAPGLAQEALEIIRARYMDFGPTLACEKLRELHGLMLSIETVRKLMVTNGLWRTREDRQTRLHQPRMRRACYGELVQIDGSYHQWFEARGSACSLLVYIDDATGKLLQLHFSPTESATAYFTATKIYLGQHGKPQTFYADKAAIFRSPTATSTASQTQFHRALTELDIDLICANSPQAKGRVERMNRTLQDRFVKELRLAGISTIEAANAWSVAFIADFNGRFAKEARGALDAHCALEANEDLELILAWRDTRKLSSKLTLQHRERTYVLKDCREARAHVGRAIAIHMLANGQIVLRVAGVSLEFTILNQPKRPKPIEVDSKSISHVMDQLSKTRTRQRKYRQPSPQEKATGVVAAKKAATKTAARGESRKHP